MDVPELSLCDVLVVPVKEGKEVSYYSSLWVAQSALQVHYLNRKCWMRNKPFFLLYEKSSSNDPVLN